MISLEVLIAIVATAVAASVAATAKIAPWFSRRNGAKAEGASSLLPSLHDKIEAIAQSVAVLRSESERHFRNTEDIRKSLDDVRDKVNILWGRTQG